MNKIKLIPNQRTRAHRVLFLNDSPFRSRTVENKKRDFKRTPKHRNQEPL